MVSSDFGPLFSVICSEGRRTALRAAAAWMIPGPILPTLQPKNRRSSAFFGIFWTREITASGLKVVGSSLQRDTNFGVTCKRIDQVSNDTRLNPAWIFSNDTRLNPSWIFPRTLKLTEPILILTHGAGLQTLQILLPPAVTVLELWLLHTKSKPDSNNSAPNYPIFYSTGMLNLLYPY